MERTKPRGGRPQGATLVEETDLVARVRAASGKSQADFAEEVGCSMSSISKMENQNRGPGTKLLKKRFLELAKKYGVTP